MRLLRWCAPAMAATLLIGLTSCSKNQPLASPRAHRPRFGASGPGATPPDTAGIAASTNPVAVKEVNWDGYQDTIKSLKGKVVVVDFWQTT